MKPEPALAHDLDSVTCAVGRLPEFRSHVSKSKSAMFRALDIPPISDRCQE
jgi:hypothetical protein